MLTLAQLSELYRVAERSGDTALPQSDAPGSDADEIIASAMHLFGDASRSQRVMLLRLLSRVDAQDAARGILLGLNDDQRRVREVAIKCASSFLTRPEIIQRLITLARHRGEIRRIRGHALNALSGLSSGRPQDPLPDPAAEALAQLARDDVTLHRPILERALRLQRTPGVQRLLLTLAELGEKEEAALVDRALQGERVINLGEVERLADRKRIARDHARAFAQVFYWVPRAESTLTSL